MYQVKDEDIIELSTLCPQGIMQNVNLAMISQWRIGGIADLVICPASTEEVQRLMK